MKIYTANKTNFSFYEKDESHSKEEWMSKLNLSEAQFSAIAASDFTESEYKPPVTMTVITKPPVSISSLPIIILNREDGSLSADDIAALQPLINDLLNSFNS